jgi:3-hydroxymyristoyl/3-hydroxydecanoyl-(acyl carrier protein) dehydratase
MYGAENLVIHGDVFEAIVAEETFDFALERTVPCFVGAGGGELSVTQLAARFATHPLQPEMLSEWCDGNTALLELYVPATLIHFSGHFPGVPILPGVVQIDWVVRYAAHYFARCDGFQSLEQIKFLSMVHPGTTLRLALAHDPGRARITFRYYVGERDYATGRIVYSKGVIV